MTVVDSWNPGIVCKHVISVLLL